MNFRLSSIGGFVKSRARDVWSIVDDAFINNDDTHARGRRGMLFGNYTGALISPLISGIYFTGLMLYMGATEKYIGTMTLIGSLVTFTQLLAPLIIAFPALAVDDYKLINLSKLFNLCKGNKMAIFFGQFVIMFPYMLLSKMFAYIYALIGVNNFVLNACFVIITLMMAVLDASFRGAFFAHIYQFLKYYDKDK